MHVYYYSDDTFATLVGQQYIDRYGSDWFFGSTGPWRIYDRRRLSLLTFGRHNTPELHETKSNAIALPDWVR
ncbi:MAG: hypothetical protein ACLGH0_11255 [Thermoanaerobaculia bacterium]